MEKNKFEKQVREKLTGLNIQPSEKTWTGIESRIGKKNSRRKILWLFFIGIFILAGGIILFQMNDGSEVKTISHLPEIQIQEKGKIESKFDSTVSVTKRDKITGDNHSHTSSQNSATSLDQKSIDLKSIEEIKPGVKKEITTSKLAKEKQDQNVSPVVSMQPNKLVSQLNENKLPGDLFKDDRPTKLQEPLSSVDNRADAVISKFDSFVEIKSTDVEIGLNPSLPNNKKSDENEQPAVKNITKELNTQKQKKSFSSSAKKWEIGFSMAAGKFYLGDGIHFGSGLEKSNVSSDLSYSNPGPSIGTGYFQPISGPSVFENSIEFKAGLILKKPVSRKSSFSTGLGYAYYTNTILIGDQLPSGNYSSVGMLTSYRNNIHFIELPLSLRFQINDQAKIPLNLSAGVNISQFISSDAMQYKNGFYSVDNSLFHKTQIGFDAGFYGTFFNKLSAGPYYSYGINQLSKEGLYGKKHLNSYGLKAEFIFRKNK